MSKEIFLFIASLLLLFPIIAISGELSLSLQLILSAPFIFLFGIPHGAIDNVLYLRNHQLKNIYFIGIYLCIIGSNVLLWIVFPLGAYLLFLLLSAYHFGQSQFSHYFKSQRLFHQLTYLLWGVSILSALILFNLSEIRTLMQDYQEFAAFDPVHQKTSLMFIFSVSTLLSLIFLVVMIITQSLRAEAFLMECIMLSLIFISFYLMPLIIGFTLYFVILHSFKVLREEYRFLKLEQEVNTIVGFVKLLTPFSVLSFLGLGILFLAIRFDILTIPYGYVLLIMISSITLPHVFVMNQFYKVLFKTKFYP